MASVPAISASADGAPAASATAFMMASTSGYRGYERTIRLALWTGFRHDFQSATCICSGEKPD